MTTDGKGVGSIESVHSSWTVDTLAVHHSALRECDIAFQAERDRRYKEVREAEEKAAINVAAMGERAMELAREIQTYKDVKANELREQLGKERLDYASKLDLKASVEKLEETLKPIVEFVSLQRGKSSGIDKTWTAIFATAAFAFGLFGALSVYNKDRATPQVVYVPAVPTPQATK